jgi:hypothetical protein
MPALTDPRIEQFCIHLAADVNQSEAARRAGFSDKTAANLGCRLAKREDVRMRVMELKDSPDPTRGTVGKRVWIISEAVDLYRDARKADQFNAARLCLEFLANIQGYMVDHRVSDSRSLKINVSGPAELREALKAHAEILPPDVRAEVAGEVIEAAEQVG